MKSRLGIWIVLAGLLLAFVALPRSASAAVTVTTAQLQGTQLRVNGTGAVPNAGITVNGTRLGQADDQGRFSLQQTPFSSPTCTITVSDGTTSQQVNLSGCTPSATPTPTGPSAPTPLAPANSAQVVEPFTLSWSAVSDPSGIDGYNVEISTSATFQVVAYQNSTNVGTTQLAVSGLPTGTYFWHVDVVNGAFVTSPWSAAQSFTITGQAAGTPGTPSFTGPANAAQFHPYESFNWTWTSVPNAVSYIVEQDIVDSNFSGSQVDHYPQSGTTYNQEWGNPLTVYARVRGVAADGTLGLPSAVIQVNITYNAPLPPAPTLIGPANGAHVSLPITFSWSDDPNPQQGEYTLEISDDPNFTGDCPGIAACVVQITGSSYTLPWMTSGLKYWRVQAMHGDSSPDLPALSPWSAVQTFIPDVPPAALASLQVSSPTLVGGSANAFGQVTLTNQAPPGGAVVSLSSSNSAVLSVPANTTVAANTTTAPAFALTTHAVSVATTVTITATYAGQSLTAQVTVVPPMAAPTLLSPVDNSNAPRGTAITFDWSDVSGAASYQIQISDSSNFSTLVASGSVIPSQYTTSTLPAKQLWWRVRAVDGSGNPGTWSASRRLTVQ